MAFCRMVERLYDAVPLRPFRDGLIRVHMEKCPACQARLLSLEEARGLLVAPDALGDPRALWHRLASSTNTAAGKPRRIPAAGMIWRWAAAAVLALAVAGSGFWLLREIERPAFSPAARFEISYVNVGGQPAQTFVYQAQGSDTVFVWAQKTL
jgi:hypothetical protein